MYKLHPLHAPRAHGGSSHTRFLLADSQQLSKQSGRLSQTLALSICSLSSQMPDRSTKDPLSLTSAHGQPSDAHTDTFLQLLFRDYPLAIPPALRKWSVYQIPNSCFPPLGSVSDSVGQGINPESHPTPSPSLIDPLLVRSSAQWHRRNADGNLPHNLREAIRTISEAASAPDSTAATRWDDSKLREALLAVKEYAEAENETEHCDNALLSMLGCAEWSLFDGVTRDGSLDPK